MSEILKNIIIGTAQLGSNYGIANKNKNYDIKEKFKLLNEAYKNGCKHFDTAHSYPESHSILGEWKKIYKTQPTFSTKIPNLKKNKIKNFDDFIAEIFNDLYITELDYILLHNSYDFKNKDLIRNIDKYIKLKTIKKFGLSIYDKEEIFQNPLIKTIQLPANIFNHNILESDELNLAKENKVEIQIRSIFVQGLILMHPKEIPQHLENTKCAIEFFHNIAKEINVDKSHLAILMINKLCPDAKIIIGIDNINQLKNLITINKSKIKNTDVIEILKYTKKQNNKNWDPRNWKN